MLEGAKCVKLAETLDLWEQGDGGVVIVTVKPEGGPRAVRLAPEEARALYAYIIDGEHL